MGLAGLAFGNETVRKEVENQLQSMVGGDSAKTIVSMMAAQKHGTSLVTTIIGLIALLFGASGVFGQIQDALNTIWEVKAKPGAGIWKFIRSRFLSFSMVLGVGFLLLVSMALTTFLSAVSGSIGSRFGLSDALAHILNFVVSFGVISLLFAMIFKYLPDVKIPFPTVWVGAIGTALLFTAGKYLLALYLGRQSTTSSYGAAGSVIGILMWVYYASLILLFGAEFTHVYARQTAARIEPDKYAEPVTQEERAQEGIPRQAPAERLASAIERPVGKLSHPGLELAAPLSIPAATTLPDSARGAWKFAGFMLATGFVAGLLLKVKSKRRG